MRVLLFWLVIMNTYSAIEWGRLEDTFPKDEKILDIVSPAMSYRKLLEWKDSSGYQCLIYKISSQERPTGVLYLGRRSHSGCSIKQKEKDKVLFEKIKKLRVKLTKKKTGMSYQVIVIDKSDEETVRSWRFPFAGKLFKRWKGISLSLDQFNSQTTLASEKVCSYFDLEKMKVNFNNCHKCLEGSWTPVLNRLSASYPIAICGVSKCGERNEHPCLKMTSVKSPISCEEAKRLVVCQAGRSLICLGSGFLQCR